MMFTKHMEFKMAARMGCMRVCFLCRKPHHYKTWGLDTIISRNVSDLVVNHKWRFDPRVEAVFTENPNVKHRNHPGVIYSTKRRQLPPKLQDAISLMIEKYPTAELEKRAKQLAQYTWSRHRPIENQELKYRAEKLEKGIRSKYDATQYTSSEEVDKVEKDVKMKVVKNLRKEVYHWKPIEYDAYKSFLYLVGRISADFSTLRQIFSEIAKRNPEFKPETLFDFGSGVGSSIWAANATWEKALTEHYCVDSSADMNTIARLLLQGGEEEKEMAVPGVFFRQFMPPSAERRYDLVVSAFSLMELPNQTERLNTLYSLWQKTKNYLVIVENGTAAGFQTVLEARDFILHFNKNEQFSEEDRKDLSGHVFAPCPHDGACGRFARQDGTPCNFAAQYKPLTLKGEAEKKEQLKYSYVVLKKGERGDDVAWPRIVREVSTPSKRVHVRTCCPNGDLQMSVITSAKHGKDFYWCARACKWGDLLPAVPHSEDAKADTGADTRAPNQSHSEDTESDAPALTDVQSHVVTSDI